MQILPLEPTEAITFDMYGTLLDSVVGFAPEFEGFLKTKGYPGSAPEDVQAWEMAYLHGCSVDTVLGRPRTPFEVVRRLTLSQLLYKLKIGHTKNDIEELVTAKATPTLFPHVKELRTRVQGKFQMTALFNGDLKSPDRTVNGLDILVDRWTSDERAGFISPTQACINTPWVARRAGAPRRGLCLGHPQSRGCRQAGTYIDCYDYPTSMSTASKPIWKR